MRTTIFGVSTNANGQLGLADEEVRRDARLEHQRSEADRPIGYAR